ncbi:MAG: polyphenol oxidase family protein, partial [Acidobacteriota bacterium]
MKPAVMTIPRFERISFLIHGFGNAAWTAKSFGQREEWRDFALLFLRQVHSDVVRFIENVPGRSLRGDAMITHRPGIFLVVKTADCLPALLVDEGNRVIAAVHCGWKGTRLRLLQRVVRSMAEYSGSDPSRLLAAFGPCIGGGCYEVGEDIRRDFRESGFPDSLFFPHPGRRRKYFFDLREANRQQLIQAGVGAKRIFSVDVC